MLERLDWTERLAVALTVVFLLTLVPTWRLADPWVWLAWGIAMVALSGVALIAANRAESAPEP